MLVFGLHSHSHDRPSDLSDASCPKCKQWPPNSQKIKCSFSDYVQLLMISRVIRVMKVAPNAEIWPPNENEIKNWI